MQKLKCLALFVALGLFSISVQAADPVEVRFGDIAQGSNAVPIGVMIEQGFDRKHGVVVDYQTYPTLDGLFTAIRGGAVDVGFGGWTAFAQFRSKGSPITMVFPVAQGKALDVLVPTDSPIKAFGELKGKPIGTYAGAAGTATVLLRVIASKKYGFDPAEDGNLQYSSVGLLLHLVERNEIEAAVLFDPLATKAIASGKFRSIGNLAELYKEAFNEEFLWIGYAMTDEFMANHPEAAKGLVAAWVEAIKYVKANPTVFNDYGRQFGLDEDGIKMLRERIVGDYTLVWNDQYISQLENFAKLAREVIGPGYLDEIPASAFTTKLVP